MGNLQDKLRYSTIVLLCFLNLGFGIRNGQSLMAFAGAVGLLYVATTVMSGRLRTTKAMDAQLS